MNDLIEALTIFAKYLAEKNARCPTNCSHDELGIMGVDKDAVSPEDTKRLDELGFFWSNDSYAWISFRFGSA